MFSVFNRWGDDRINTDRLLSLVLLSVSSLSFGCKTHTHGPLIFTTSPSRPHSFCFCLFSPKRLSEHDSAAEKSHYMSTLQNKWLQFPHHCHWLQQLNWNSMKRMFCVSLKRYQGHTAQICCCCLGQKQKIGPVDWSISILTSGWFLCCSCWRFLLRGLFRGCCLSKDQPKLYTAEEGSKNRWSLLDRRFKSCYSCILEPVKWLIQHIYKVFFFSFFVEGLFFGITERPGT